MALFELSLELLAISILLLFVARRFCVPYPALLAVAGCVVAFFPWADPVAIEPRLALALFVAPAVMQSALDMPPRLLVRHWLPLISLAVLLVLVTTAAVAWVAYLLIGLPLAAAVLLGAVVAPPDAAAASAVLEELKLPRRTMAVLQGESLLNDAVVLLIFGAAEAAGSHPSAGFSNTLPMLLAAIPGAVVLGVAFAFGNLYVSRKMAGTLSSIVVQIVTIFGAWVVAAHLGLSSIVAVAAQAMVLAHLSPSRTSALDRLSAGTVWKAILFVLNVLAFLIVGLQARIVLSGLEGRAFWQALGFAFSILAVVVVVRMVWIMMYRSLLRMLCRGFKTPGYAAMVPTARTGILVSWCGMRGLVTLATALALPAQFPGRDLIVLTAFVVVFGTLVIQGFTIRPLISLLRIDPDTSLLSEISKVRTAMLGAAISTLDGRRGEVAEGVRAEYVVARAIASDPLLPQARSPYDQLRLELIASQRQVLDKWRRHECVDDDAFHCLEDELDRAELAASTSEQSSLRKA